jgi:lysylphosphatidylglycerol synthetase-like protein (DUF2156 family)
MQMQSMATFWPVFGLVLAVLVLFGVGYNALTQHLERSGQVRGFVSLLVAGGTAVTIMASGLLIGLVPALVVLACFVASGLPMMVGSVQRYVDERAADEKAARELAKEALDESPCANRQE